MPNYGVRAAVALYPGSQGAAFTAEQPVVPKASQSFALWHPMTGAPNAFSVEIQFAADPGVFEIDVQTSDTDTASYYETYAISGIINAVDANFHARAEFVNIRANFVRLNLKTRTNAVNLTATINV
jgi:hypothetical protein